MDLSVLSLIQDLLVRLLDDPAVISVVLVGLSTVLPQARVLLVLSRLQAITERVPLLGVALKILRLYVEQVQARQEGAKVREAERVASVLVNGAAQQISQEKLTKPAAGAMVTQMIQEQFGLEEKVARTVTESAVRTAKRFEMDSSR